jgi:hypothetical protein
MTVAESWLAYRALVTGIADWGVQCSIAGVNPNDPRTWNSHLHVLNTSMPGTWQRYINDAALAARDQQSFTNPALLALAAEKTRVMVSTSRGIGTPGTTVTYSSRTMDSPMPIANHYPHPLHPPTLDPPARLVGRSNCSKRQGGIAGRTNGAKQRTRIPR